MESANVMPLAERLRFASTDRPNFFSFYMLFLRDYYCGLTEVTKLPHFAQCYDAAFSRYDPAGFVALTEMVTQVTGYVSPKRDELLFKLLIEPFAYIKLQEGS